MKTNSVFILLPLFLIFSKFPSAQNQAMELMKVQTWKGYLKIEFYEKIGVHPNVQETHRIIEGDVILDAAKSPSGYYFAWPAMFDTSKNWNATLTAKYNETEHCLSDGTNKTVSMECNYKDDWNV